MIYRLTVWGYDSGLNEVLGGNKYDPRTRRVFNLVKSQNDALCMKYIRCSKELRGIKFDKPIVIHYLFLCKNKRRDRMNIASAFDKSFEDALQKCHILKNDGFDDMINATFDFRINEKKPRVEIAIEELNQGTKYYDIFPWGKYL